MHQYDGATSRFRDVWIDVQLTDAINSLVDPIREDISKLSRDFKRSDKNLQLKRLSS